MADTNNRSSETGRDSGATSTTDRHQPSALGGEVATRSKVSEAADTDGEGTGGMVEKADAGGDRGQPAGRGD